MAVEGSTLSGEASTAEREVSVKAHERATSRLVQLRAKVILLLLETRLRQEDNEASYIYARLVDHPCWIRSVRSMIWGREAVGT